MYTGILTRLMSKLKSGPLANQKDIDNPDT